MITKDTEGFVEKIRGLLENEDLEVHFKSSTGDYSVIYSTSIVAKEVIEPIALYRTYWMIDGKGSEVSSPWDTYQKAKQIDLATNLVRFANYEVVGVYSGWRLNCPKCGSVTEGKIWRNSPDRCEVLIDSKRCGHKFDPSEKSSVTFSEY
jgi:hypothetical protein